MLEDARAKRKELGDELFFQILTEEEVADPWGGYGEGSGPERFEAALDAAPGSVAREGALGWWTLTRGRALVRPGPSARCLEEVFDVDRVDLPTAAEASAQLPRPGLRSSTVPSRAMSSCLPLLPTAGAPAARFVGQEEARKLQGA